MGAPSPGPVPPPPRKPLVPPGNTQGAQTFEITGVRPSHVYIYTLLPNAQIYNLNVYARSCKQEKGEFQIC
jgi:hypothetical protein